MSTKKLDHLVEVVAGKLFNLLMDQPKEQLIKNRYENRKNELETDLIMVATVYNEQFEK